MPADVVGYDATDRLPKKYKDMLDGTFAEIVYVSGKVSLTDISDGNYKTCPASATTTCAQGGVGAIGDYLAEVVIIPGTTAAGIVQIQDGANSAITIWQGGATTALVTLIPFAVPLGIKSTNGAWKVITNANVTAIATGHF